MNKNIKKEAVYVTTAFVTMMLGSTLNGFGLETLGRFIVVISILTGIVFGTIANVKFWFGKKPPDHLGNKSDQNDE